MKSNHLTNTASYYVAFIALGMMTAVTGPVLTRLADNTGSDLSQIGTIFISGSLGYVGGSLLSGRLYDRWPGHPIMALNLLSMAVIAMLIPFISQLWLLLVAMFGLGLMSGMVDVGGNTLLVWLYAERVTPYMNGLHLFFGIGAFVAPLIIATIGSTIHGEINLFWSYWPLAISIAIPAVALLLNPSPAIRVPPSTETTEATRYSLVALIALFLFLYVGAEITMGNWIAAYISIQQLANPAEAAMLASAFWGAFTLGRLISIPLGFRFRPRTILGVDLLGCLFSMGMLLLGPTDLRLIWVGTLGLGFAMASIFPTTLSMAERRLSLTGQVTSFFFVGSSLGGMIIPWLTGYLFEHYGPHTMFPMLMLVLLADFALFFALVPRHSNTVSVTGGL